jgi:hypothetical protein
VSDKEKTHVVVAVPEMDVRQLADYMAGSDRKKRAVLTDCKYRPIARLMQHKEARIVVASAMRNGEKDRQALKEKADFVRSKLATDDFESATNEANADFIQRFSEIVADIELPTAEILPGKVFPKLVVNGVKIRFSPSLRFRRLTKTNKVKIGGLMLRYAKGKALAPAVGDYQSALICGLIGDSKEETAAEADKPLCLTLDVITGTMFAAPSKSASMYANTKAACQSIAEQWPNLPPPKGAKL